jgi:imidazolonepropionase-like amidohydrolase
MASAFGLPKEEALKAVTLYPAQLLGVDDQLGSLQTGKAATLIVTNGDPLDFPTQVEAAYIDGRKIDLTNRQTRLRDNIKRSIVANNPRVALSVVSCVLF